MKHTNTVVTVVAAAAVLVAAYAIGLLIRHARTPEQPPAKTMTPETLANQNAPGGRRVDRKARADEIRRQREQVLEKMKTMTEEEKRKFTEQQVLNRVSPRNGTGQRPQTISGGQPGISPGLPQTENVTQEQDTERDDSEPNEAGQDHPGKANPY